MPKETCIFRNPLFCEVKRIRADWNYHCLQAKALYQLLIDAEQAAPKVSLIKHLLTVLWVLEVKKIRTTMDYLFCTMSGVSAEKTRI